MTSSFKTNYLPIHFRSLGIVFIIIGIVNLVQLYYVGSLFLLIGISILLIHHGVVIDANKNQIKQYLNILGFRIGHWQDMSQASAVQIIELNESQRMWVSSIKRTSYYKICRLYLSLNDEHILLMKGNKEKLLIKAELLCQLLNIELINKTKV